MPKKVKNATVAPFFIVNDGFSVAFFGFDHFAMSLFFGNKKAEAISNNCFPVLLLFLLLPSSPPFFAEQNRD